MTQAVIRVKEFEYSDPCLSVVIIAIYAQTRFVDEAGVACFSKRLVQDVRRNGR